MTTLLAQSLNVGAATLALWMGTDVYYDYMQNFGFGRPTGIDIMSEAGGLMPLPGDPMWEESFLGNECLWSKSRCDTHSDDYSYLSVGQRWEDDAAICGTGDTGRK